MRKVPLVVFAVLVLAGCARHQLSSDRTGPPTSMQSAQRWVIVPSNAAQPAVWRINTQTGGLDYCNLEALIGKSIQCTEQAPPPQPEVTLADMDAAYGVAPRVGDIRYGYRFVGGDPSKKESWVLLPQHSHPWK